jgi:hypothetical protein
VLGQARPHHRQGQVLIEPIFADIAQRHHLDHREIHAAPVRPSEQAADLVLVDALERHGVDLHLQAGGLRGIDAG